MSSNKKRKYKRGQFNKFSSPDDRAHTKHSSDHTPLFSKNTVAADFVISKWKGYLPAIAFAAACILVFYPPYFKGLFMNPPLYITHVLTALILIMVAINTKKENGFLVLQTPMDWAALTFAFAYLLSLIGAVHPGEAFFGFIRILNYLAIYWIVSRVVRTWSQMETMLRVLLASGAGVAAIGILASLGYSSYPHAFNGTAIVSTLQYSNTTAAFLAAIVIVAISLWIKEKHYYLQLIYITVGSYMNLIILISSSKGAWLALILGIVILFLAVGRGYRVKAAYGLLIMFFSAAAAFLKFYPAIISEGTNASKWLLICLLLSVIGVISWNLAVYLIRSKSYKFLAAIIAAAIVLCAIPILVVPHQKFDYNNLSIEALELFDLKHSSYYSRVSFNNWAMQIIRDYPVNGTGAGGWAALYRQYQNYNASTKEVHNHYLNIWIEAGTIGFLAWMFLLAAAFWSLYRMRNRIDNQERLLTAGTAGAAIVLLSHALIDFDLSIPSMAIFLWTLFGLINSGYRRTLASNPASVISNPLINCSLWVMVTLCLLVSGLLTYSAYWYAVQGTKQIYLSSANSAAQQTQLQLARHELQKAIRMNPLNGEYQAVWATANALCFSSTEDPSSAEAGQYYSAARRGIDKGEKLLPYHEEIRYRLLESAILLGNGDLMLKQAEGWLAANPNNVDAYTILANMMWEAFQYYLTAGNEELAQSYAEQLVGIEKRLNHQVHKIDPAYPWLGQPLELPAQTREHILMAREYLQ